jgi:acyl-CoA synthetase (AMP-forming)/AMP-acid ligase II
MPPALVGGGIRKYSSGADHRAAAQRRPAITAGPGGNARTMTLPLTSDTASDKSRSYVAEALRLFDGFGSADAVVGGGRRLTYDQLRTTVLELAAALQDHGIGPGTGVLVLARNTVEVPALQLALHLVGARSAWISPAPARSESEAFARLSGPDVFVYDPRSEFGEPVHRALGVPALCLGPGGQAPDLLAPRAPGAPPFRPVPGEPDPATCLQTSGTTGVPKLIHHRQTFYEQILALAANYRAAGLPLLRHLSHSPMALPSGHITSLFNLFTGGVLFLENEWDAGRALATIERERITSTFVTPALLYQLLDHPDLDRTDCSSLFMLNVGAGPAAPSRLRQAIARFGPVLRIVYGLSEVIVVTALPGLTEDPDHPERLRSSGLPYGDVRVEVRGPDGQVLGPGETGEIHAASRLAFAGYWGRPDLTAETIVGGWVRTGDLGYLDADGYLYLVDRMQDAINTGTAAWNIYCRPIEDILAAQPGVRAAAVIGVPDDVDGEVPHAYVVPAPGVQLDGAELAGRVEAELSAMWAPRSVDFLSALPLTSVGKVDKLALRARYATGPST